MGATMLSGFVLQSMGLKPIRSLQPMIKEYHPLTLIGLFLTGTFLEEIFFVNRKAWTQFTWASRAI